MKKFVPISLLILTMTLSGCAWTKRQFGWNSQSSPRATAPHTTAPQTIVTPDESLSATVLSVNTVGRFVVLNFPEGGMPKLDQHMFLYRAGLKTGEVKIAGPQQDTSIVADIVSGDAQPGDTVRDQ